jgi:hypothetical protein
MDIKIAPLFVEKYSVVKERCHLFTKKAYPIKICFQIVLRYWLLFSGG